MIGYPQERNLDGIYFRVLRNNKYHNICFTDMTKEERENTFKNKENDFLRNMCLILAQELRNVGDCLDIAKSEDDDSGD